MQPANYNLNNKTMSTSRWTKGVSGNPNGRVKGSMNKSNEAIRLAYTNLIENNLQNITDWLASVAREDPARALDFIMKLSPFVLPRLSQQDVTSNGEPIKIILPEYTNAEEVIESFEQDDYTEISDISFIDNDLRQKQ